MSKREAKKVACRLLAVECDICIDNAMGFDEPIVETEDDQARLQQAFRELRIEMQHRGGAQAE